MQVERQATSVAPTREVPDSIIERQDRAPTSLGRGSSPDVHIAASAREQERVSDLVGVLAGVTHAPPVAHTTPNVVTTPTKTVLQSSVRALAYVDVIPVAQAPIPAVEGDPERPSVPHVAPEVSLHESTEVERPLSTDIPVAAPEVSVAYTGVSVEQPDVECLFPTTGPPSVVVEKRSLPHSTTVEPLGVPVVPDAPPTAFHVASVVAQEVASPAPFGGRGPLPALSGTSEHNRRWFSCRCSFSRFWSRSPMRLWS